MDVQVKEKFLQALYNRPDFTRTVSDVMHLTRCPYCGDSTKLDHGHFYIKVDLTDNSPIVYYCHKCPAHGAMNKETLELLGIDDSDIASGIKELNKNNKNYDRKKINTSDELLVFDYKVPPVKYRSDKIKYIENRLQVSLTQTDVKELKVVESLKEFNKFNGIKPCCKPWIEDIIDKCYVGFLTTGSSHILFRDITEKQEYSWLKYPITEESKKNRIFYSIGSSIDVCTEGDITINLFEGVFDALSIHLNFEKYNDNTVNIAVGGKYYEFIIMYLVSNGLFGSNVTVNVYADNDKVFNKKNKANDTTLEFYKELFKNYKHLFKQVNIIYNILYKDCGVSKDKISLKTYKI